MFGDELFECLLLSYMYTEYFTKSLKDTEAIEGQDVRFECMVSDENISAEWYKDGKEIDSDRVEISHAGIRHVLEITHAALEDTGKYMILILKNEGYANLTIKSKYIKQLI